MVGAFSLLFVHMVSLGIAKGAVGVARSVNHAFWVAALLEFGQIVGWLSRKGIFVLVYGLSILVPVIFGLAKSALTSTAGYIILGISFTALFIGDQLLGDVLCHGRDCGARLSARFGYWTPTFASRRV